MRARQPTETPQAGRTRRARQSLERITGRVHEQAQRSGKEGGEATVSEVYAALSAEAQHVMDNSQPIPTQAENDALRTGEMTPDEISDPGNPEMPSIAAQQALVEMAVPDEPVAPGAATEAPSVVDVPHVSGTPTVGETLSCTMGNWNGEPSSYAYQWQSDGADVGTGGDTYVIAPGDAGHNLACVVTATNAIGSTAAPASNAVSVAGTPGRGEDGTGDADAASNAAAVDRSMTLLGDLGHRALALLRPPPVPALVQKAATEPMAYALSLSGGFIPSSWPINYWQLGYDPLPGGRSAVVYACIAAYSQTIAMCPGTHWQSDGNGGRARVPTVASALSRFLQKPNSYQSPSDWFLYLTDCLYGEGQAFGLVLRNQRFEISEIHLMDPLRCYARVAPTGDLFYSLAGNEIVDRLFASNRALLNAVPARDVLHVRLPDPRNMLRGIPPLTAAYPEVAASYAMTTQDIAFAANQSRPSGVLETELAELSEGDIKLLRQRWNEQTQGVNQGGTPILTHGMKWKPAIINARDAQIAEKAQMSDARIATAYRVPQALLSLNVTPGPQASTESLMQFWVGTGLGFAANLIEDAVGRVFGLKGWPDDYLELDFEALLRAAFKDRMEGLARGVQGGIYAPNEARAREELPKMPFGDEPRVQQQVVPLSAWAQTPPATPAPNAPPSPPPAGADPNAGDGSQRDLAKRIRDAADRLDRRAA